MSSITQIGYICDCCGTMVTVVIAYQGLQGSEFTTSQELPPGWRRVPIIGTSLRCYHQCERCHASNAPLPK